jgi:hypothetical protein
MRQVSRFLKDAPNLTVHQGIRLLRDPKTRIEPALNQTVTPDPGEIIPTPEESSWAAGDTGNVAGSQPNSSQRLVWARGHLHRVQPQGLSRTEREEIVRLLRLIQQDVESLLEVLTD